MRDEAKEKLKREAEAGKFDRYAAAMKGEVVKALTELAGQDEEFARSIVDGSSFEECMKAVSKDIKGSISDLEAFRRAVQYYEPGADIEFKMVLTRGARKEEPEKAEEPVIFDLTAFL